MSIRTVALAGCPNVGKSTLFNGLTGLRQHTGNWPGKTVEVAEGYFETAAGCYRLVDLPGTYSLLAHSPEEAVARDFLAHGRPDAAIVVCDATCLERGLGLVWQIAELDPDRPLVVCVNLIDEAARRSIRVDLDALGSALGLPVVGITARHRRDLRKLTDVLDAALTAPTKPILPRYPEAIEAVLARSPLHRAEALHALAADEIAGEAIASTLVEEAERVAASTVTAPPPDAPRLDRLLAGRFTAYPIMLALLAGLLWLTIVGANYPSALLSAGMNWIEGQLTALFFALHAPDWLHGALVEGAWRTLGWVVAVMLPPMAIFFPLFTLLEDAGYLPRVAYALDRPFRACRACGKQALCMCMGLGCNAAGVVGCRIIDSPRERLLGILTNALVPCNGRFPTLVALIAAFFVTTASPASSFVSALLLTALIVAGVLATFAATALLSSTLLRGIPSAFTLELPPYRRPQPGQILVRSLLDRTLFVLGRAAAVAAPAGLIIWCLANITVGETSLLAHAAHFLDPFGRAIGLDGVLLLAFILGLPANEIVLPIAIMAYTAGSSLTEIADLSALGPLLTTHGWDATTALCFMLFSLFHWPCSTTLLTVRRESGRWRWVAVAALLPTLIGIVVCGAINWLVG